MTKSQRKINNLYFTNCNGSVTVLLHNARTRALFGFWYLRKKATCLLAKKQKRQLWCVLLYLLKLCFLSSKNSNKFSSIKKPLLIFMHQWWKCLVFGFSFCLKAWELLLVFFFLFHLWQQKCLNETKDCSHTTWRRKTCFVGYMSTNTGEQRKISAKRGTRRVRNRSQTVLSAQR